MSITIQGPVAIAISGRTFGPPFSQVAVAELASQRPDSADFVYLDLADKPGQETPGLADIYRILAPKGLLRVCAIDLDEIVHAYLFDWRTGDGSGLTRAQRFDRSLSRAPGSIRNEEDLTASLASAGFVEVRRFLAGAGSHPLFWDREREHEHRLILEARRPLQAGLV